MSHNMQIGYSRNGRCAKTDLKYIGHVRENIV